MNEERETWYAATWRWLKWLWLLIWRPISLIIRWARRLSGPHIVAWIVTMLLFAIVLREAMNETCQGSKEHYAEYCTTDNVAAAFFRIVAEFVEGHDKLIVAAATVVIALFTATLWSATARLSSAALQQGIDTAEALKISRDAADAARKTADTAEATLKATNRPWLMVTKVEAIVGRQGPTIDAGMIYMPVKISIRNSGFSPALNVRAFAIALLDREGKRKISDLIRKWQQEALAGIAAQEETGVPLFHGDSESYEPNSRTRIPDGVTISGNSRFYLLAGATYVSASDKEVRYVANTYWIKATVAGYPNGRPSNVPIFAGPITFKRTARYNS